MMHTRCACGARLHSAGILCRRCWRSVDADTRDAFMTGFATAVRLSPQTTTNAALRAHHPFVKAAAEARRQARAAARRRSGR